VPIQTYIVHLSPVDNMKHELPIFLPSISFKLTKDFFVLMLNEIDFDKINFKSLKIIGTYSQINLS